MNRPGPSNRMKPWEPLSLSCDRCEAVAVRRVVRYGDDDMEIEQDPDGRLTIQLGPGRPDLGAALACEEHAEVIMNEWGEASSSPLRMTWEMWFFQLRVMRPVERMNVAVYNWRWDRGVQGKRFGLRLVWIPLAGSPDDQEQAS